ncbi:MAG TPA: hypothetical protein DD979_07770 [Gammaproteobacteria bacterium]|jgi:hypothetical protein|nr:hypothetical protein [Gammaproteobacteria bacterium]
MKPVAIAIVSTLALGITAINTSLAGEEQAVALADVPEKLLQAAGALLPNATFKTANTEKESDGSIVYEIQGLLEDGRKVEVDLFKDGKVQEFEVEFSKDLVPGAVLKALDTKMPGFTPEYIEASHSPSKKVVQYEFVGKLADQTLDLDVSADGRRVEVADQ